MSIRVSRGEGFAWPASRKDSVTEAGFEATFVIQMLVRNVRPFAEGARPMMGNTRSRAAYPAKRGCATNSDKRTSRFTKSSMTDRRVQSCTGSNVSDFVWNYRDVYRRLRAASAIFVYTHWNRA